VFFITREQNEAIEVPAQREFRDIATRAGAKFLVLDEAPSDYRDNIHLNDTGQLHLAGEIEAGCLH